MTGREKMTEGQKVDALVDELFHRVEKAQGQAHISDGETFDSVPALFARVRGRLQWAEEAVRIIRGFLREYDQQPKRGRSVSQSLSIITPAGHRALAAREGGEE